jgi:MYXO-CTERM domain-containing protein
VRRLKWLFGGCSVALALVAGAAEARPYVTIHDDGTFMKFSSTLTEQEASSTVVRLYDASGAPRPDVISVWTAFDLGGESFATFFLIQANAIQGIGFDGVLTADGLLQGSYGPLNAILLHNNVLVLQQRAMHERADPDAVGYAQYLFLLEFSHQWLGAARVPGNSPHDLGVFPHWSFWFNSGDSPPGGNSWVDNGNGTFSTVPVDPIGVKYSNLDLYLMGLVDAGAVSSINVLQNAVAPTTPTDPETGGKYAASSLTDFDSMPLTVTATSKTYTISDIIAANGVRIPATSPHNYTLGIVLMVPQDADAEEIAADQAIFDPISVTLVPAFQQATGGIATLTVVTDGGTDMDGGPGEIDAGSPDSGVAEVDAGTPDGGIVDAGSPDSGPLQNGPDGGELAPSKGGCSTSTGADQSWLAVLLVGVLAVRRRPGHQ